MDPAGPGGAIFASNLTNKGTVNVVIGGVMNGDFVNNGGTLSIVGTAQNSTAEFGIAGNFSNDNTSNVQLEFRIDNGIRSIGRLVVDDTATLAGKLTVTGRNLAAKPSEGDRFIVVEYDGKVGTFGQIFATVGGKTFSTDYMAKRLDLFIPAKVGGGLPVNRPKASPSPAPSAPSPIPVRPIPSPNTTSPPSTGATAPLPPSAPSSPTAMAVSMSTAHTPTTSGANTLSPSPSRTPTRLRIRSRSTALPSLRTSCRL
jgi:hypothetical protein